MNMTIHRREKVNDEAALVNVVSFTLFFVLFATLTRRASHFSLCCTSSLLKISPDLLRLSKLSLQYSNLERTMAPTSSSSSSKSGGKGRKVKIALSPYVRPAGPVQLTRRQTSVLKDDPLDRVFRVKDTQVTEAKLVVGDLVWAQLDKSPFWPSIISSDPDRARHHDKRMNKQLNVHDDIYHVQYIGPREQKGWCLQEQLIPFLGYEKVKGQIRTLKLRLGGQGKPTTLLDTKFVVSPELLDQWTRAIAEAEVVLEMNIEERMEALTDEYIHDDEPVEMVVQDVLLEYGQGMQYEYDQEEEAQISNGQASSYQNIEQHNLTQLKSARKQEHTASIDRLPNSQYDETDDN